MSRPSFAKNRSQTLRRLKIPLSGTPQRKDRQCARHIKNVGPALDYELNPFEHVPVGSANKEECPDSCLD